MEAFLRAIGAYRHESHLQRLMREQHRLEALEVLRDLRQRFARGEIDAAAYERGVQLMGFEHLDF